MTLKKSIFLLFVAACVFTACDKKLETTDSGLEYRIFNDQEGELAKEGDAMKFHMLVRTGTDSVLMDTRTNGEPLFIPLEKAPKGSIQEGLFLLAKGDSADILVNVDSIYTSGPRPPFLPAGSKIKYTVKVIDVVSGEDFKKQMMMKGEEAANKENELLTSYLAAKDLKPLSTPSGLMYIVEKSATGRQAKTGDAVQVHYTGTLLDGTQFDSSKGGAPFEFTIGAQQVIAGWDEGVALMKEGEKFRFFIPSQMAYGPRGYPDKIPPFSTLIFEIELVKIK